MSVVDDFRGSYKAAMVRAYPGIALLEDDDAWYASSDERNAAWMRVLRARNLRQTHVIALSKTICRREHYAIAQSAPTHGRFSCASCEDRARVAIVRMVS